MARQSKVQKTDGLGPYEIAKIRSALRLVWHRSHARALVVKRCLGADGFPHCEKCGGATPQLKIDHKLKVGDLDAGYLQRLFCPSQGLQGLCGGREGCHNEKTKAERREDREKRQAKKLADAECEDFF